MFTINMFGKGIRYFRISLSIDEFERIEKACQKNVLDYVDVFFNLDFMSELGLDHYLDVKDEERVKGFLLSKRNNIEIKKKTKRLKRIDGYDLVNSPLLIDPYDVVFRGEGISLVENKVEVLLVQEEVGKVFKFNIEEDSFDINQLTFIVSDLNQYNILGASFLTELKYKDVILENLQDDTLVAKNHAFVLNP